MSWAMQRLCERPGCSDPASVAYGMRAEDLVFWLDALRGEGDPESDLDPAGRGVLCRRHADSMVVPRDWTLDDLREPELHLFRPPEAGASAGRHARRRSGTRERWTDQLSLGIDAVPEGDPSPEPDPSPGPDPSPEGDPSPGPDAATGPDPSPDADSFPGTAPDRVPETPPGAEPLSAETETETETEPTETEADAVEPWTPSFDAGDDLDGLLAARSPLLARAFRGTDRTENS
jgi:hypothetical protein